MSSLASSTASCGQDAPRLYVPPARPRLGPKPEELELARRIRAGDQDAVLELANTVRGIIGQYVRFYRRFCKSFTQADLWQEGYLAAVIAAQRYDPVTNPCRFSTFAWYGIRWRFIRAAYHTDHLVRHDPAGSPASRVRFDFDLAETFDESDPRDGQRLALERALRHFPDRTRRIFALKSQGQTLERIGRELGISKERVRQILARAITEIQERTRNGVSTNGR